MLEGSTLGGAECSSVSARLSGEAVEGVSGVGVAPMLLQFGKKAGEDIKIALKWVGWFFG